MMVMTEMNGRASVPAAERRQDPAASQKIRILIVDDHHMVRVGLRTMLAQYPDLQVVDSADSGLQAMEMLAECKPDVILLDLRMPGMNGLDMLTTLRKSGSTIKVIMVTSYEAIENAYRSLQAGADGYLLKSSSEEEMIEAIQTVHSGGRYVPADIAARVEAIEKSEPAQRMTIRDIARMAGVSVASVSRILHNKGRHSEETKDAVMKLVKQYNFQQNDTASSLSMMRIQHSADPDKPRESSS
jgi:DNA-binding NarL/FixJ family response regulator